MSDVKVLRLSTGEDVIAKVDSGSEKVTLEKPFVIIPQQMGPGKPVQLMLSLLFQNLNPCSDPHKRKVLFQIIN